MNFHGYKTVQILLSYCNPVFCPFLLNLTFIGILLASCGTYWTIKMFGKISVIIYLCVPSISLCGFALAIILTYMEGLPLKNSEKFRCIYLTKIRGLEERKALLSLKSSGLKLGPYGTATAKLGILIWDDIIRNTVNALLLDSS